MFPPPPRSTLFPYTTLFRSLHGISHAIAADGRVAGRRRQENACSRRMMDIVVRDLIVVTRNIDAGTVGAIGGRRTRRVGNLKTIDPYIIGLDIETLHHHAALGLKVEQFACTTGGEHLNPLVIVTGGYDDRVATVE